MRYAVARFNEKQRDTAYRIYVTETLRMMTESTAKIGRGQYMTTKFADLIKAKTEDKRTGDEIAADVIRRSGLEVIA